MIGVWVECDGCRDGDGRETCFECGHDTGICERCKGDGVQLEHRRWHDPNWVDPPLSAAEKAALAAAAEASREMMSNLVNNFFANSPFRIKESHHELDL